MTAGELSPVPREARPFQGAAAGLLTRSLAGVVDGTTAVLVVTAAYLGFNGIRFLAHPVGFAFKGWGTLLSVLTVLLVLVAYLTVAWATSGRTYGDHVMGLRVVSRDGGSVGPLRAGLRALTYVVFPLGLLWCAGGRSHRSVQDIVLRTAVVYDWRSRPDTGLVVPRSQPSS
jgi:uncharacterized RDD family membrane protein YckC